MEKKEDEKNQIQIDSSFDEEDFKELNDNFKNKSNNCFNFDAEKEKNFSNKCLEDNDINELYDVLNEINQAVTIDTDTINKKEYIEYKKQDYNDENTNIIFKDEHYNACQEILSILKKPSSNKTIRNRKIYNSEYDTPFKPLLQPKKVSLVGKVFYDIPSDINSTCSSKNNNNINNENNNH
jgi:hypothetical protein